MDVHKITGGHKSRYYERENSFKPEDGKDWCIGIGVAHFQGKAAAKPYIGFDDKALDDVKAELTRQYVSNLDRSATPSLGLEMRLCSRFYLPNGQCGYVHSSQSLQSPP